MADIGFKGLPGVEVDLFDLEQSTFTRTHALQDRYASRGKLWHVVGTELIARGGAGRFFDSSIMEARARPLESAELRDHPPLGGCPEFG